jgi:hypothetical protein
LYDERLLGTAEIFHLLNATRLGQPLKNNRPQATLRKGLDPLANSETQGA